MSGGYGSIVKGFRTGWTHKTKIVAWGRHWLRFFLVWTVPIGLEWYLGLNGVDQGARDCQ